MTERERCVVDHSIRGLFSLVIKGVQEEDSGLYTCEARNDTGVRQVTVELTVEGQYFVSLLLCCMLHFNIDTPLPDAISNKSKWYHLVGVRMNW